MYPLKLTVFAGTASNMWNALILHYKNRRNGITIFVPAIPRLRSIFLSKHTSKNVFFILAAGMRKNITDPALKHNLRTVHSRKEALSFIFSYKKPA
jgi:hypothetical protein